MANIVPIFVDFVAVSARQAETNQNIPVAAWDGGCNLSASNANGIGIGTQTKLDESLPSWTLLDQKGVARAPQKSQSIGQIAGAIKIIINGNGTGTGTDGGEATLTTLDAGWVGVTP